MHAVPSITVLLNLLPELPERKRGMFEFATRMVVSRVVYRLLKALPGEAEVEDVVRQVLPNLSTLSAKLELVNNVGHQEGIGHGLATESAATDFERDLRDEVRAAPVEDLTAEPELLRLLFVTLREAESGEASLAIDPEPRVTGALLESARSETRTQSMGSRAVQRSPRLAWDVLVELYGDETTLKDRLDDLRASEIEADEDLLDLADEYLDGWRPDEFQ